MFKEKKGQNYGTKQKVLESALNEESKLDWLINDSKAYHAARRLNCLDEATKLIGLVQTISPGPTSRAKHAKCNELVELFKAKAFEAPQ